MKLPIGPLADIPPGAAITVESGDTAVAVFNIDGELYAIDNVCAHNGGPLAEGSVADGIVTCPWHWWRYDLATGKRLGSDQIVQQRFEVTVEDDQVFVEVPEPSPVRSLREQLLQHAEEWSRDE